MLVHVATERQPVPAWPPAVLDALDRLDTARLVGLELTLPDQSVVRYAHGDDAAGLGYEGRVKSWGSLDSGVNLRDGRLGSVALTVGLLDGDGALRRIEQRFSNRLRGSLGVVYLHLKGHTVRLFVGALHNFAQTGPTNYELELRPREAELRLGQLPQQRITLADYPRAKGDVVNAPMPLILGRYDSAGLGSRSGLVPTYRVDAATYLVSLGRSTVRAVFVGETVKNTSDYTMLYERAGKTVTEIKFAADPGEDATVTCDVDGYQDAGGVLITNPVRQVQHVLDNFVYGRWTSGAWVSGAAPLDLRAWDLATAKLARRGYEGSAWIGELQTPATFFDAACESLGLLSWWTLDGTIAVGLLDPLAERTMLDEPWLRGSSEDREFRRPRDVEQITRRLAGDHALAPAGGRTWLRLAVSDHTVAERTEIGRRLVWSPARAA